MTGDKVLTRKQQSSKEWHAKNPTYGRDWYRARRSEDPDFDRRLHKMRHGMTQDSYDAMLAAQGGVCAVCKKPETMTKNGRVMSYHIDHDHSCCPGKFSCGKCVRGLLCGACNSGLGKLGDNIDTLQSAIAYLAKRPHDADVKSVGHPPSASKRIAVDFDQTLYPFGDLFGGKPPIDGAVEAMKAFKESGLTIYIFSSRLSPDWWTHEGWNHDVARRQQTAHIQSVLARDGIPFDYITGEKIPAIAYIDDKAIEFTGTNWDAIKERVLSL